MLPYSTPGFLKQLVEGQSVWGKRNITFLTLKGGEEVEGARIKKKNKNVKEEKKNQKIGCKRFGVRRERGRRGGQRTKRGQNNFT